MDGNFDILTMSYTAPPLPQPNGPPLDPTGLLTLDPLDHTSNFDNETFAGNRRMADYRFVAADRSSQYGRTTHRQRFLPFAAIPEFARWRKSPLR